jgi:DNA replication and repair protein RecF
MVLLAWGRSHRTATDAELIRWDAELARVEGRVGGDTVDVALVRPGSASATAGNRKRIRVNGVARRASGLVGILRTVVFAPEEMLLVAGSPSLRRTALDQIAGQRSPVYLRDLTAYNRALQQRNSLLRAIREETAARDELRYWDQPLLEAGAAIVAERLRALADLAAPLGAAHAEIAPEEAAAGALTVRYATNAPALPGESPRDALSRRLAETAEKEVWNGATLVGPHRDDLVFELDGRDLAGFASRGQQRTAILAFKLAELDLLTALDGRSPLLLLDDVFSELDPVRRSHLVRRIAALPQAFVTTTTLDDLDPALRAVATAWEVVPGPGGAHLEGPTEAGGQR